MTKALLVIFVGLYSNSQTVSITPLESMAVCNKAREALYLTYPYRDGTFTTSPSGMPRHWIKCVELEE